MKYLSYILALGLMIAAISPAQAATREQQRDDIQGNTSKVLKQLYRVKPESRERIHNAAGYAVFTGGDVAALFFSGGAGHGLAHDNQGDEDTYMKMASVGAGLGLGVKDYRLVFVFRTADAYSNFIDNGLDLTGHVDLAAKNGPKGGAIGGEEDILPNVRVYQLTRTGLMAQAMLRGTKYWRDSDLNNLDVQSLNDTAQPSRNNVE